MKEEASRGHSPLGESERRERRFLHNGRAVLALSAMLPTGDGAAAMHTRALVEALCAFAEQQLLPRAAQALEALAAEGRGHAFRPHRYRVCVMQERVRTGWLLTVQASYRAGRAGAISRMLRMHWSADGALQYRPPRGSG